MPPALAASGSADASQDSAAGQQAKPSEAKVICRKVETIGTRLKAGRVCHTASRNGPNLHREDRSEVDKIQANRWTHGDGGT